MTSIDDRAGAAVGADPELRARVEDLYARYAECISDDRLEDWPDFFVEDCVYRIIPRINHDRGLPVSLILAESRGGVIDRMTAIRHTMVYSPRYVLPTISGVRLVSAEGAELSVRSSLVVYETISDTLTRLLVVGRTFDRIAEEDGILKFVERSVVLDSEALPSTIIYPL